MMAEYKLTYFNSKGIAEPIRLIFALAKVPFEDIRIPASVDVSALEIPAELKKKLPYGQLPLLEFGDSSLSQSGAISRYLARKFNLMGGSDWEAAKIDELLDALKDYAQTFRALRTASNEEEKKEALKNLLEQATPKYLGKFEETLKTNGGQFMVGKSVSYADLAIFYALSYMKETFGFDVIQNYPALQNLVKSVGDIPQLKEYMDKRPKTLR